MGKIKLGTGGRPLSWLAATSSNDALNMFSETRRKKEKK